MFLKMECKLQTTECHNRLFLQIDSPMVGVFAALNEADDDIEEELSARAKGAEGGGLELEVTGGLNGLGLKQSSEALTHILW